MRALFDASALINLVRDRKDGCLDLLEGGAILSLTPYEVGNALWKEVHLKGNLNPEEARYLQETFELLFGRMEVIKPSAWREVLDLAVRAGITFYDAAYVAAAMERDLPLVTDDERLVKRIKGGGLLKEKGRAVKILPSNEIDRVG